MELPLFSDWDIQETMWGMFLPFLKILVDRQEGREVLPALSTAVHTGESLGDLSDGYSVEVGQTTMRTYKQ